MGGSSSSKGGGSSSTRKNYATIACAICKGPLHGLVRILLGGEVVWSGPLMRNGSSAPVNLTTKYGTIRLYWGTETQPADSTLNQYEEHPSYPGIAYVVFVDYDHGQSTNAYNAEFIVLGGAPDQLVVTGEAADATTDSGQTVNPITTAVEVLTSPSWLGLPLSDIDTASAQAVSAAVQAEKVGSRCSTAVSPLFDSQREARAVLSDLAGIADAWLRVNPAGKVEFGRWEKSPNPASVRTITFDDLTDWPSVTIEDQRDTPNSFAIEFTDRAALHKSAKIVVDDLAGIEAAGMLRRNNLNALDLISYEQALRAGQDAIRRAQKAGRWSGAVRYPKALNGAGGQVQPGDLLSVPISAPGQSLYYQMIQVDRVTYPRDATAPVKIEGRFQPGVAAVGTTAYVPPIVETPDPCVPPINLIRAFSLPAAKEGEQPPVHIVACRPELTSAGFKVGYDDTPGGDFPLLGIQGSFALPMSLDTSASSGAGTIRCSLLPTGANGQRYDRDANYIRSWTGGAVEGRGDNLIALIVGLSAGSIISMEACSVSGTPTLVDADTFDIPVLRGRLRTTARAWTAGAFTSVEVWIIPSGALVDFSHEDFISSAKTGLTLYFHAGAYDHLGEYSPAEAWAERTRRVNEALPLGEYALQPNDSTLYPIHTFVVSSGNYTGISGFGILNNDSCTVPSAADGSSPILGPAVTTMQVFIGSKEDSANWTFAASPSAGVTGNLVGQTWTTTGFTVDSGYVDITASRSGYSNVVCRFVLSKAKAGAGGSNSAVVMLYQRAASAPSAPSTTATYTFATSVLTGHNNGWTQTIPASNGQKLYAIAASASSSGASDVIAPGEWSTPVVMAQDGSSAFTLVNDANCTVTGNSITKIPASNGWNEAAAHSVESFTGGAFCSFKVGRTNSTLVAGLNSDPTTNNDYSSIDYGWYATSAGDTQIYENGTPYYGFGAYDANTVFAITYDGKNVVYTMNGVVKRTVAASAGLKLHFDCSIWGGFEQILNIAFGPMGAAGNDGNNGVNSCTVFLFQRTATSTPPSVPSASCTYTFSTKSLTGHNNGWATSMPTSGGAYRWQTTATALSATDTDTIATGEWSTPAISAQDGTNGNDATAYWVIASAAAIQKNVGGVFVPSPLVFTAKSQVGTGNPGNYSGRFIIAESSDGSNFTDVYSSSADEASVSRTPAGAVKAIRARLYQAGGFTVLLDEETVPVVSDGQNGTNGINAGVVGIVSTGGAATSSGGAVEVSAYTMTLSMPAGTRKASFIGTVANASGVTRNINVYIQYAGTDYNVFYRSLASGASAQVYGIISVSETGASRTVKLLVSGDNGSGQIALSGPFVIE
jgi:hypothetical protein